MSEKSVRLSQRRRRYQLRLRGEKKGVSPVVATLILILIAVAAAAALYLWLVVWQGNITGGIGQPHAQTILTVGGSTSAYPFDNYAVQWFEQNNSDVSISNNEGGTTAGLLAVCGGQLNIGVATTPETASTLISTYNCPSADSTTLQITPIAYDAVDLVTASANTHGLLSIQYDTLSWIYLQGSSTAPTLPDPTTFNGVTASTIAGFTASVPAQGTEFAWSAIPAAVDGATVGALGTEEVETAGVGAGGAACASPFTADICATTFGATVTPCGFSICASGAQLVVPIERADAAGATLTLESKLFGATSSKGYATSFAGLGYSGCGSNNLLSDCGITLGTAQQGTGDSGVLSLVSANANAIGYASDGLARSTAGISIVPFNAVGQTPSNLPQTTGSNFAYGAVVPTTGSTGTIAGGVTASTTLNNYAGWRPFLFVSLQPYSGVAQEFVTFILDPANNQALASAAHEVSVYSI